MIIWVTDSDIPALSKCLLIAEIGLSAVCERKFTLSELEESDAVRPVWQEQWSCY